MNFLFTAKFQDNQTYKQNEQDISQINPEKSCFYDILQIQGENYENPVTEFHLSNGINTWSLYMDDGHFELNTNKFLIHEYEAPITNRRLIYFRRRTISSIGTVIIGQDVVYRFGWQANNLEGKNIQHLLSVA